MNQIQIVSVIQISANIFRLYEVSWSKVSEDQILVSPAGLQNLSWILNLWWHYNYKSQYILLEFDAAVQLSLSQ